MAKVLRSAGHHLIPVKENLVDKIWTDRPERPCKPLLTLGLDYTGQAAAVPRPAPTSPPPPVPWSPSLPLSQSQGCGSFCTTVVQGGI